MPAHAVDVIPSDTTLVKGSHGRITENDEDGPVFISDTPALVPDVVTATDVERLVLSHLFDGVR